MKENSIFLEKNQISHLYFAEKTSNFFRKRNNSYDLSAKSEKKTFKLEPISSFIKTPLQYCIKKQAKIP